jgi:putative transposase
MIALEPGNSYHIYNRGNNREQIFRHERNYEYFLHLYQKYLTSVVDTFAYCLLGNHFHFLIRVRQKMREVSETSQVSVSGQFSHLFNAYAKAFNKAYKRTGSLFQERFRRRLITSERYLYQLLGYVHLNPQRHGFVQDFRKYPFSSYQGLLSDKPTFLAREEVMQWFGGKQAFDEFHSNVFDEELFREIISEDEDWEDL